MILKLYLFFLDGYKILYSRKYLEINEMVSRMNIGLEKFIEVSVFVDKFLKELVVKEKELVVVNVKVDKVSLLIEVFVFMSFFRFVFILLVILFIFECFLLYRVLYLFKKDRYDFGVIWVCFRNLKNNINIYWYVFF